MKRKLQWSDASPERLQPQLDAKVQRYRMQQRERVEAWKDQLLNQVFEKTDPASHADLITAMLEVTIEWRIAHLGPAYAEDLLNLAFERIAKMTRAMLD